MPNGTKGDHPITDLTIHGKHPFTPEIEELILRLDNISPMILHLIEEERIQEWVRRDNLWEGRQFLFQLIEKYETQGHPPPTERELGWDAGRQPSGCIWPG